MNWDAIGAVGELLAAVAVILTLIYVARQVRDGSRQIRLNTTSNLSLILQESFSPIYGTQLNQWIWHQGLENPLSLSEEHQRQFFMYMDRIFYGFQLCVSNYRAGALEEDVYKTSLSYFQSMYETSGGRMWIGKTRMHLSDIALEELGVDDGRGEASTG